MYSIFNQDFDDFEVIVVDNNSSDNTEGISKKYNCNFLRVSSTKAQARKIGFYQSRGDYLLILDSDMFLERGLLGSLLNSINNNNKLDAITIDEEFPPKSVFHVAKNIEKRCYRDRLDIQSPRFYKRKILDKINWDNIDDGWDEYEIFLETRIPRSRVGTCQKKIYLMEKPVNLGKKLHHGKILKQYKEKYEASKVVGEQFNFRHRFKLLKKAFEISYAYGLLVFIIKFIETFSLYIGSTWSAFSKRN